jgi:hypothetical protein
MKASILLIPVATAHLTHPACIPTTVSVTATVYVDSVNFQPYSTQPLTPVSKQEAKVSTPTWSYTYTSLQICSKGEVVTWDGQKTTLSAPTAHPTVVTKAWTDSRDWPATWKEIYTTLTVLQPGENGAHLNGQNYVLTTASTSTCTLTSTHYGPPSHQSSGAATSSVEYGIKDGEEYGWSKLASTSAAVVSSKVEPHPWRPSSLSESASVAGQSRSSFSRHAPVSSYPRILLSAGQTQARPVAQRRLQLLRYE